MAQTSSGSDSTEIGCNQTEADVGSGGRRGDRGGGR